MLLKVLAASIAITLTCSHAVAQPKSGRECVRVHEGAQVLRKEGKLLDAREMFVQCAHATCPAIIRSECTKMSGQLAAAVPSVIFVIKQGDQEVDEAEVFIDGEPMADPLDGRVKELDPGRHTIRVVVRGADPVTKTFLLRESEQRRRIEVAIAGAPKTPVRDIEPVDKGEPSRSGPPTASYALFGVGAAGLAAFTYFGLKGLSEEDKVESCTANCEPGAADDVRKKYYLPADIALVVGLVAIGAGGYLWYADSQEPTASEAARVTFGAAPLRGGGRAVVKGRF